MMIQFKLNSCGCSAVPIPFAERLVFPYWMFLAPLFKINYSLVHGFIYGHCLFFFWHVSIFIPAVFYFDCCSFAISMKRSSTHAWCRVWINHEISEYYCNELHY